ncbi:MAG: carboxypeptidase-like regulatory domain-containing protein, partial [Candidatus Bathyarchaeota archaeon]|nr:carboxypeptidase-like regulatory domain-containing protein [Candidatus Bathyarchaeota archaeon]
RQPDVSSAVCTVCYTDTKWDSIAKKCCGDDGILEIPWCSVGGGSCLLGIWHSDHCSDKNKNCDEKDIDCGGIDCNVCSEDTTQEEPPGEELPEEELPEEPTISPPIIHNFDIIKAPGITYSFTYEELIEDNIDRTRLIAGRTTTVRYKALNDLKTVFLTWNHKKYEFEKEDSQIFVVDFPTPPLKGDYDLSITFVYPDDTKEVQKIPILVDPLGYIYKTTEAGQQERIKGAKVSLYSFNKDSKTWTIWKADKYGQKNPQITDVTGEYAFLVPEGKYYLEISKEGYETKKTEEFEVADEPVNKNIELREIQLPSLWQRFWWVSVILIIFLGLIVYFWRKKIKIEA